MNKEHIKSIVLFVLVICNLFLGSKILITKKLWPDGYNFFVNTRKSIIYTTISKLFKGSSANAESKSHISVPTGIIINTGYQTTRFSLKSSNDTFEDVYNVCSDVIKSSLSEPQKNWSYASKEEWQQILTGKSIYLSYGSSFESSLYTLFAGASSSEIPSMIQTIDSVAITAEAKPSVYLRGNDVYIKCTLDASTEAIDSIIDHFQKSFDETDSSSSILNYSFELKFDQVLENQHAVLESMIPIYSNPIDYSVISAENPILKNDGSVNTNITERILASFGINPNTVRWYPEAGGTKVFVENNGTLKIHSNGLIEYNATDGAFGLRLTQSVGTYGNICAAADFMDSINAAASSDKLMSITSFVSAADGEQGTAYLTFDYTVDGVPVKITNEAVNHAVEIKVENGYLKTYKHMLRSYDITPQIMQAPLYIDELDRIIAENPDAAHTYINKMYLCYKDDLSEGQKDASWQLEKGEQ